MRIRFLLPYIVLSGGVKSTFELARRLHSRGHDVRVYYPTCHNIFRRRSNLRTTLGNIVSPILGRRLTFDFETEVPVLQVPFFHGRFIADGDAVIGTWWEDIYPLMRLPEEKGRKYHFIRHHEIWGGARSKVERAYRFVNRKIAISTWLKDLIEERYGQTAALCPNGIDTSRFCYSGRSGGGDRVVLGVMYRDAWEWKGMAEALQALERLTKKWGNRLSIVLFGDEITDPLPFPCEAHTRPFGEEIRRIYSDLDIFLFTSRSEGFGNPPLEAMACRTAVVSTRVGGVPDYGVDGETLVMVEPRDVDAMVREVSGLIEDRKRREALALKAEEAARRFTWDRSVDILEGILAEPERLTVGGSAPRS